MILTPKQLDYLLTDLFVIGIAILLHLLIRYADGDDDDNDDDDGSYQCV